MNPNITTSEQDTHISYGYALKMFLGWSILYLGTLIGFIEFLRQHVI